jgi:hypothetical protein
VHVLEDEDKRLHLALVLDESQHARGEALTPLGRGAGQERIPGRKGLEHAEKRGEDVLQGAVQHQDLARHLLAHGARVVVGGDLEVAVKDLDPRPEGSGRPVGDRARLEDKGAGLGGRTRELAQQAGLAHARLAHQRHRAVLPLANAAEESLQDFHLRRPPHEARQPPRRRRLQARARGGGADNLVDFHRRLEPAHRHGAQQLHVDPSPGKAHGVGGGQDGARLGHLFHAGGQMHGLAHGGVVRVQLVADGAHHRLARVQAHADLQRHAVQALDVVPIPRDSLLHAQGGIAGSHRVILVGQGRPEQGHDPVAHHLVHRALVAVDGVHHVFEERVEQLLRLLGIAVGEQLHRALEIREEHGDVLALAVPGRAAGVGEEARQLRGRGRRSGHAAGRAPATAHRVSGPAPAAAGHGPGRGRATSGRSESRAALGTEARVRRRLALAAWTHDGPAYRRVGACTIGTRGQKASPSRQVLLQ